MSEITAEMVKRLRDATNVSMMDCKRALAEAGGDMDKATRLLREKGIATAVKRASRAANQGLVASAEADGGRTRSIVEVNCETDFVARNDTFKAFVAEIAARACSTDAPLADLVRDEVTAKIAQIGENIVVRRNARFVLGGPGVVASYIHFGGKVGVLAEVGCQNAATASADAFRELAKDLTLQIAAAAPHYLRSSDIPADVIASERDICAKQITGKPPQIVQKIVDGKMKKYFGEVCLVDQPFVKEPKQTVTDLLTARGKDLADTLAVRRFLRFQLGE
jgi:elongation factor Ts